MIGWSGTTKPVDFRKGADGLAALVRETMQADPFSGAIYVFRAKRADRVKLIYWDGTGVCGSPSGWRMASSGGRAWMTPSCDYRLRSYRHCWKGSIGSGFTQRERCRRRYSRHDCGTVNQCAGNAGNDRSCMV